jgi:hypothetical protein
MRIQCQFASPLHLRHMRSGFEAAEDTILAKNGYAADLSRILNICLPFYGSVAPQTATLDDCGEWPCLVLII